MKFFLIIVVILLPTVVLTSVGLTGFEMAWEIHFQRALSKEERPSVNVDVTVSGTGLWG